ncbi:hypothetical protein HPB47_022006 [Ixodes persulcatus]|uniref:Uncharacterized protein n=1 Tax=Ixodes persulcatus TaxID=34615 RepID=A0AC60QEC6_IXOPE|nr:hypothetical protein HPB47_022006 [Ixodes persulcatus]
MKTKRSLLPALVEREVQFRTKGPVGGTPTGPFVLAAATPMVTVPTERSQRFILTPSAGLGGCREPGTEGGDPETRRPPPDPHGAAWRAQSGF